MPDETLRRELRQDALLSLSMQGNLASAVKGHRIAVVGGGGFIGSWMAEVVTAINDEYGGGLRLHLLGRSEAAWASAHPYFAERKDIAFKAMDVRFPFEFPKDTTLVLFAAGIADPRIHASDPVRVYETAIYGMLHTLAAAARLEALTRFVNLSSALVLGSQFQSCAAKETDISVLDFTRPHNVYAEARRAAESLVALYSSQYRLAVSTARAFTFLGPYQAFNAPWAANNFISDALSENKIRVHGDGGTRRSYLYGSDAAVWLLRMLISGEDNQSYNLGGSKPITHSEVASMVARRVAITPDVIFKSQPPVSTRQYDFFPDMSYAQSSLGFYQAFDTEVTIERSMRWHAIRLGRSRLLRF